jgi:hypothetical protein
MMICDDKAAGIDNDARPEGLRRLSPALLIAEETTEDRIVEERAARRSMREA